MAVKTFIELGNIKVPIKIIKEWRSGARVSIARKSVMLRIPKMVPKVLVPKHIEWATTWLEKQYARKPEIFNRFKIKEYLNGEVITIGDIYYQLSISYKPKKSSSAKLKGRIIEMSLSQVLQGEDARHEVITSLVRNIIAKDHQMGVEQRIRFLNQQYFEQDIKSVRLKYNTSNWGSCSSTGNINISTRLLKAPKDVQDYVFIHELTHLIELNHSDRFWNIVKEVMPDYKQKERWLSENSHLCTI